MSSPAALAVFREFLTFVLSKHFHRNQAALADAVGIDARSLRRTMDPAEGKHTFSLEHCLQLATALRGSVNASYILQKADKADLAAMLETLYGRPTLSQAEEALLDVWNRIDGPHQDVILAWARQTADVLADAKKPRRRRKRTGPPPRRPRSAG